MDDGCLLAHVLCAAALTDAYGVEGIPVPLALHNDDAMTCVLLLCAAAVAIGVAHIKGVAAEQVKDFTYAARDSRVPVIETAAEVRAQLLLAVQTCLLLALLQYSYTLYYYIGEGAVSSSMHRAVAVYFGMFAVYFAARFALYALVNSVFWTAARSAAFAKALLFITAAESAALLPAVLLIAYVDLPARGVLAYVAVVIVCVKIMTFYKCYVIFFARRKAFVQIILYLCALEGVPVAALWRAMGIAAENITANI